jgi:hypothetical protein
MAESDLQIGLLPASAHRRCGDDDQEADLLIRLDDDFPRIPRMSGFDNPSSVDDVHAQTRRLLKHTPEIHLGKVAFHHSLEKMGAQTEIPFPRSAVRREDRRAFAGQDSGATSFWTAPAEVVRRSTRGSPRRITIPKPSSNS